MDYTEAVHTAISFIHREYDESITVADLSGQVYLSPSYFSTVFRTLTGYTIKDYILRYRLYRTALALKHTGKPILAIAFENGFSSQQALTKSFTQVYGIAPARFRRMNPDLAPFPPENLLQERGTAMDLHRVFENVRFVKKEAFYVVGIETDIHYNSSDGTHSIGGLYKRWNEEKLIDRIPDQVNDTLTYGMTYETSEDDTAKYCVAVEVSTLERLPAGFIARKFEACEYAVFQCTLEDETSGRFFQYFFKTFLKERNLSQPEAITTKHGNTYSARYPVFEAYDRHFVDESSTIEIYAPILRLP
ncbi:AraC family transcriptional regulator [Paenibacillus lycopersici]|uniref:AraC family transcriptional regulator n=1 Tax=Paenibacillus lycopersici TaxID=2704462 RepID=A0A6C0G5Q9_9BACL|nr:helix-turn-helix domain-containing protein [Paenibacillus lycopersici]QHT63014.1 AraC family transcriptional regulator [Paenibacillus lycopersici]